MSAFSEWKRPDDPEGYRARVAERHAELEQHIEQYLAAGGRIDTVPQGATAIVDSISTDNRRRSQKGSAEQQRTRSHVRRLTSWLAPAGLRNGEGLPTNRADALVAKTEWYYTGKPCKNGHQSLRRTNNGQCRACGQENDDRRNGGR